MAISMRCESDSRQNVLRVSVPGDVAQSTFAAYLVVRDALSGNPASARSKSLLDEGSKKFDIHRLKKRKKQEIIVELVFSGDKFCTMLMRTSGFDSR